MRRAFGCCACGSLPERIEMKMTLSTPRMISRNVSVTRREQAVGGQKCVHAPQLIRSGSFAVDDSRRAILAPAS